MNYKFSGGANFNLNHAVGTETSGFHCSLASVVITLVRPKSAANKDSRSPEAQPQKAYEVGNRQILGHRPHLRTTFPRWRLTRSEPNSPFCTESLPYPSTFNRKPPSAQIRFCKSLILLRDTRLLMIDSMLMLKTRAASETPSAVRTIKDLRFSRFRGMTLIPPGFSRRQGPKPDPFELGAIRSARGGAVACYRIPVFRQQKPGGKRQRGGAIQGIASLERSARVPSMMGIAFPEHQFAV